MEVAVWSLGARKKDRAKIMLHLQEEEERLTEYKAYENGLECREVENL